MNTIISRTDSFETWRKGTNKISAAIGDSSLIGSNFSRRKIILKNGTINFEINDTVVGTIAKDGVSAYTTADVIEVVNDSTIIVDNFSNGNFVDTNEDKLLIILDSSSFSGVDFTAGEDVTGLTSNATAKVFSFNSNDSIRLVLYNVEGNFLENEIISNDPDTTGSGDSYGEIDSITNNFIELGETVYKSGSPAIVDTVISSQKDVVTALNEIQTINEQFDDLSFTNDIRGNKIIFGDNYLVIEFEENPVSQIQVNDVIRQNISNIGNVRGVVSAVDGPSKTIKVTNIVEFEGNTFSFEETDGLPGPILNNEYQDLGLTIADIYYSSDDPYLEWNDIDDTFFIYSDNSGSANLNVDSVYANNYYGIDTTQYFVAPSSLKDVDTTTDDLSIYVKGNIATDGNQITFDFDATNGTIEWDGTNFLFNGSTLSELISVESGASSLMDLTDVDIDTTADLQNEDVLIYNSSTELWEPAPLNLEQLGNVTNSGISDGFILRWNGSSNQWEPSPETLVDPDDSAGVFLSSIGVSTTTASGGGTLAYDGSGTFTFAPADLSSLDNIGDVSITGVSTNQVLKWSGSAWINGTVAGLGSVVPEFSSGNLNYIAKFSADDGDTIGRSIITEGSNRIGIGLSGTPTAKLQVDGDIRANSFTDSASNTYYLDPSDKLHIGGAIEFFQSDVTLDVVFEKSSDGVLGLKKSGESQGFQFYMTTGNFLATRALLANDWALDRNPAYTSRLRIYDVTAESNAAQFFQNGDFTIEGSGTANAWNVRSDEKLKNNILTLEDSLVKVKQLRGVSFTWKSDENEKPQIGLIAQEVQKVVPEVVEEGKDGTLGVNYPSLIAHLIEAIKTQDKRIEELERKLDLYK